MTRFSTFGIFLLFSATLVSLAAGQPEPRIHTFYYGWYATEEVDGKLAHWNHQVMGDKDGRIFGGGEDIGANFFPALGNYSSNDPAVIEAHLEMMVQAEIGILVASWWGPDSFEDRGLPALLDGAARHGLQVAFHLEPFPGRDADSTRESLVYLVSRYGNHPACYRPDRWGGRPVIYIYDSYLTPAREWAKLLQPEGEITIRDTELDAVMIGLWVGKDEGDFFLDGGFDGYYTYFGSDGFTWGSTSANWDELKEFAAEHAMLFIPCVGPGYLDTRIRPWNATTTRDRQEGRYYDKMFASALVCNPTWIGITSFNEWHEGTQIEPAVPKSISSFEYEDYSPFGPEHYLDRTRYWVNCFRTQGH
ncbi:MAG: hypothetical protein KOO60_00245 [Gemmatimonadales bacterium]|nr:hypothetical protein [Gemmatimonadales bacterium]